MTPAQYPVFCLRFGLVVSSDAGSGYRSRWVLVAWPSSTPPFHAQRYPPPVNWPKRTRSVRRWASQSSSRPRSSRINLPIREFGIRDVAAGVAVGALPEGVHVCQGLGPIPAAPPQVGLGVDEIGVTQPEHREVGVGELEVGAVGPGARLVGELGGRDAVVEVADAGDVHCLAVVKRKDPLGSGRPGAWTKPVRLLLEAQAEPASADALVPGTMEPPHEA